MGGLLREHVRGATVAWAQDQQPMRIDDLVVRKLIVSESALVGNVETCAFIAPSAVVVGGGRSTAILSAGDNLAGLALDSVGPGGSG